MKRLVAIVAFVVLAATGLHAGPSTWSTGFGTGGSSGGTASQVTEDGIAGEALVIGDLVVFDNAAGVPRVFKADADGGGEIQNPIGYAQAAAALGGAVTVVVGGTLNLADVQWDVVPGVADVGKRVCMSLTAGHVTLTCPLAPPGSTLQKVSMVRTGGAGAVRVIIQFGDASFN